ncbi:MAG: LysM peptidoglycan-binding domain-containing protein [Oscillospiraceae bacterium]|jgi:hypothetical protein|nr:LysM peptidoglycan-binding domain-containing protein [Oscillospiraceae bacterium]
MAKYQLWLTANGEKDNLRLPIVSSKFQVSGASKNSSLTVLGLGELTIPQPSPAQSVSFSGFFPAHKPPTISWTGTWPSPKKLVTKIKKWKDDGTRVHLIVTNSWINLTGYVDTFACDEGAFGAGDIGYSFSLKASPLVTVRKITVKNGKAQLPGNSKSRSGSRTIPGTYTVIKGDSLYLIAKKLLGDGAKWKLIYNANKAKIKDPHWIYPGQVFVIPKG